MVTKNRTVEESRGVSSTTGTNAQLGPLEAMHDLAESMLCAAFDSAVQSASHSRKLTNDEIANACGISEKAVRIARETKPDETRRPLAAVREMFLPRPLFYAYQRAKEAAYERFSRAPLTGCDVTQARVVMSTALGMLHAMSKVLLDDKITDDEIPDVLRELDATEEQQRKLRRALTDRLLARVEARQADVRRGE